MRKLKEGTARGREKERDEYIRYNVDYKKVSESYKEKIEYGYEYRIQHNRLLKLNSMCFIQFLSLIRSVHRSCAEVTFTPYSYTLSYYMCINVL